MRTTRGWIAGVTAAVTAVAMGGLPASAKVPSGAHSLDRADVKLTANHPGGQAGYIGIGSGDLDGDGFEDVVVGAMFDDTNGDSAGAVYVAYGPITGDVDLAAEAKLLGELPGDFAGETLEASHDLDGDGYDDLVIGAPGRAPAIQPGTPAPGQIYVIYGEPDRLSGTSDLVDVADAVLIGEHPADTLGHSLDAMDLDGDGWPDLVIGASGYGGIFPAGPGKIHVIYGGPDRFDGTTDVTDAADAGWLGEQHGANTGFRIQDAGDLDGDGIREVLIGAQVWGGSLGAAYLIYGGERHSGTSSLIVAADARFVGAAPGDIAGTALAGGGDLDGDGFDDFAVSAPGVVGPGATHVFYGGTERITGQRQVTDADATLVGDADGDATGRNVAITGDLDRDGFHDLAVGALGDDEGGQDAGAVSIVPGGQRLTGEVELTDVATVKLTGEAAGDAVGRGLHATGDLDRDGRAELLISAEGHDAGGEDAGAVYGIFRIAPGPESDPPEGAVPINRVASFDPESEAPEAVVVDDDGNAYVSMALTHEIKRVTREGEVETFATLPIREGVVRGQLIAGIEFDEAGNLYAAVFFFEHTEKNAIWRVGPDGGPMEEFAPLPASGAPNALAFDDRGLLYVSDSLFGLVWVIDLKGNAQVWKADPLFLGQIPPIHSPAAPFPVGIDGITFDSDGEYLYAVNFDHGRLMRIGMNSDGSAGEVEVVVQDDALVGADGVDFDRLDRLHVAVGPQDSVVRVSRFGEVGILFQGEPLHFPTDVVFDGPKLYVTSGFFQVRNGDPDADPALLVITTGAGR